MPEVLAIAGLFDDLPGGGVHSKQGTPGAAFSIAELWASSTTDQIVRYSSVACRTTRPRDVVV